MNYLNKVVIKKKIENYFSKFSYFGGGVWGYFSGGVGNTRVDFSILIDFFK